MTFTFEAKEKLMQADPKLPFTAPASNKTFKYWFLAPGPEFLITIARVVDVTDPSNIKCIFFDPLSGTEINMAPVTVPLDGIDAWPSVPSTLGAVANIDTTVGQANCVVLCVSDKFVRSKVTGLVTTLDNHPELFRKHPEGKDGGYEALYKAVKVLSKALRDAGGNPEGFEEFNNARSKVPDLL